MKICIISCFDWYDKRVNYLKRYYIEKGLEVVCYTADFNHIKKEYVQNRYEDISYVHVPCYKKNLSLRRVYSHYHFANSIYKCMKREKPDYIHALIPPNFLAKKLSIYVKKNKKCKLYFDVIDMWPESMPINSRNQIIKILFDAWRNIRDKYINDADVVFTECDLYQKSLEKVVEPIKLYTLHLVKEESGVKSSKTNLNEQEITFAYLGSINHLIDIDKICQILKGLSAVKKVKIRIIGSGERKQEFIERVRGINIECVDEGAIYDEKEKHRILGECDLGLNIMKETVCVGLTTKSIDYFEAGLPILNNIPADTEQLVDMYNAGYNVDTDNIMLIVDKLANVSKEELKKMRDNAYRLYQENFTVYAFASVLNNVHSEEPQRN